MFERVQGIRRGLIPQQHKLCLTKNDGQNCQHGQINSILTGQGMSSIGVDLPVLVLEGEGSLSGLMFLGEGDNRVS